MLKTIFMGTPDFSVGTLEEIVDKNTDLKLIFTKEDKPNSRGNKIMNSPVKNYALENNISILQPSKMRDEEIISEIKKINPDLIVVVAYGKIIPKEIIEIPKYGIINVHSSLLPKYRGASPIHSAVINGDKETGVSIMYIEETLDSGDVILKEYCTIEEEDTLGTLHDKLKKIGAKGLEKAIDLIESGKVIAEKQDESLVTFVKPISKEQEIIDWSDTKENIYNKIRGLNPFPGALSYYDDQIIKVYLSEKIDKEYDGEYGEIVEILNKKGPVVKVKNGGIILKEVKFQGKKSQSGIDIINGRKIILNSKFGK